MIGIKKHVSVLLIRINTMYINTDLDNMLLKFLFGIGTSSTTKNVIFKSPIKCFRKTLFSIMVTALHGKIWDNAPPEASINIKINIEYTGN
jgi:hypothetical protein